MSTSQRQIFEQFPFGEETVPVRFVDSSEVTDGVTCDVYDIPGDGSRDLGVILVEPGSATPLQRVLGGERTIEGHLRGVGTLFIERADGTQEEHHLDDDVQTPFTADVHVGDIMQWRATGDVALVAYEVCYPPYEDGRFENLS